MNLADILHPMTSAQFRETYWERQHLHLRRDDDAFFSSLFSIEDLDRAIGASAPDLDIRVVNLEGLKAGLDPRVRPTLCELYDYFYQGHTVLINGLEKCWAPVADFSNRLAQDLASIIQINMYATPRKATGFRCHYDTHDVFVLQIHGDKIWSLYGFGSQFPRDDPNAGGGEQIIDRPGDPTEVIELKPGDLLYLPRGVIHQATTTHRSSVHLTVGVHVRTWEHLLVAAIQDLAERDVELRRGIPAERLSPGADPDGLKDDLQRIVSDALPKLHMGNACTALAGRVFSMYAPVADGHFAQIDAIDDIGPDTVLEKRDASSYQLSASPGGVHLLYPGYVQSAPQKMAEAFEYIAGQQRFKVADITGPYSDKEKLIVVRHLVRKGFLRIVQ